jgi:NADPH-dependent 2,4-dienoyl-CoA reductase/sulfur reductase-like enzyme/nitrite reductase/ring-hydroxylating ferredoxin subunit
MGGASELKGPDLRAGVALDEIADGGILAGHADGEAVLIARRGDECFALSATCTHYGGPLGEGLFDGECVRCPWHHAAFSVTTGDAVRAPALSAVARWRVEARDGRVAVTGKLEPPSPPVHEAPRRVVIVGGGAAGFACAERLRRDGHTGRIVIFTGEGPVDRPNLSKDYLAGTAPEEWIPLRGDDWFAAQKVELRAGARVVALDLAGKRVHLDDDGVEEWDALVLATGADPVQLSIQGAELPHVHTLRSLADSRAIIARAGEAKAAVVVGASFIGLEVAASLRARGLSVDVVSPSPPLQRVLGPEMGAFVQRIHESRGVRFHLGRRPIGILADRVMLDDGTRLAAELVVVGVGVRPRVALAEQAGLAVDDGVVVNEFLETRAPGVYAVGDIARWPDRRSGERIRVEHWVVAERQGQTAARNLLGARERFEAVPFFWSQHYDVGILYVGHAARWDQVEIDGDLDARDATVRYLAGGRVLAVATVGRDAAALHAELAMERGAR